MRRLIAAIVSGYVVLWGGLLHAVTFTVTNANDAGPGSLRQALADANAFGGGTITFAINGGGRATICPTVPLPTLITPIVVDAQTQPGWGFDPIVEIDGSCQETGNGLTVATSGAFIRGLIVNHSPNAGLAIIGGGNHLILGAWFGLDETGFIAYPNVGDGISIEGSVNVRIGGTAASARVISSANGGYGAIASNGSNNLNVWNFYAGTNKTGTAALPNGFSGLKVHFSSGCRVGGPSAAYRVVLSGNTFYGFEFTGPDTFDCGFIGSYAGLSANGLAAIPNQRSGGVIFNAPYNFVGGYTAAECSYLSGNGRSGLTVDGSSPTGEPWQGVGNAHHNEIRCGYFGTDKTGIKALANGLRGVLNFYAQFTMIGTVEEGSLVVASGNNGPGIQFIGNIDHSNGNLVAKWGRVHNCKVGVGKDGTTPLPNDGDGIWLHHSQLNHIGPSGAGCIIKYNKGHGVRASGTDASTNSVYAANIIADNDNNPQVSLRRTAKR